tara:strand:+ start:261 stop:386 length:126 start_codon:yes stop_codon:yes gene_type:complete
VRVEEVVVLLMKMSQGYLQVVQVVVVMVELLVLGQQPEQLT